VSWSTWWKNLWHARGPEPGPPAPDPFATGEHTVVTPSISLDTGGTRLKVGVVTTVGNYREHNEDNYFVPGRASIGPPAGPGAGGTAPDGEVATEPAGLFVVADGMGGQLAGEEASRLAIQIIPRELRGRLAADSGGDDRAIQEAIRAAVAAANREILAQSHLLTEFTNMGTTVVLSFFHRDRAFIAGIGDSRAYRLRDGRLEQLTRDHSLAKALEEAGTIAPDEVENHRFKHVLYLYLGSPDARDGPEDVRPVDVRPGDQFLLASDGLTGSVEDEQLIELLRAYADPQQAAQALVDRALANASKDNVTCVVIHAL